MISAVYSGDGTNYVSTSGGVLGELVSQDATTTTLIGTPPDTATFGTAVPFTARVMNSVSGLSTIVPTGTVAFLDGTITVGSAALANFSSTQARASLSVSSLPVGVDTITVLYQGSTNFANSGTTTGQVVTINQATTTTAVTAAPTSLTVGQTVTFTATLTAAAVSLATGTVTFLDRGVSMGTAGVSGGQATYVTSSLSVGSDTITAVYSGDTNFVGSTSPGVTETVTKAMPTITWATPAPITYGTALSGTQMDATGSVAGTMVCSPVSGTVLSAGASQALQVTFAPTDTTDYTTATDTVYITVNKVTSTITWATPTAITYGTALSGTQLNATGSVAGTMAYGPVAGTMLCAGASQALQVTFTPADMTDYSTATDTVSITVNQAPSTTTVASAANPSVYGQSVTFTATVTPFSPGAGTPTGTVTFMDGSTSLGTGLLNSASPEVATLTTSMLTVTGSPHTITAVYAADTNFSGSTSAGLSQTVTQAPTTTTVTSSLGTSVFGQSVTFTATVVATPAGADTPTGTVTWYVDGGQQGTGPTYTPSAFSVGTYTITAVYSGDTNLSGSTSGNFLETVNQAGTTTTVASSLNPSVYGQSVTFTATVTAFSPGAGTPTGTVTFEDAGSLIGTGALTPTSLPGGEGQNDTATLSAPVSAIDGIRTHTITAVYGGDTSISGSNGSMQQTVTQAGTTTAVASSLNPAVVGQTVTFTATVSPTTGGTPTGTVTFSDGTVVLGTSLLSGAAVATLTITSLTLGTHAITATYGGDLNYTGGTSNNLVETVIPCGMLSLGSPIGTVAPGQTFLIPVNFTDTDASGNSLNSSASLQELEVVVSFDASELQVATGVFSGSYATADGSISLGKITSEPGTNPQDGQPVGIHQCFPGQCRQYAYRK